MAKKPAIDPDFEPTDPEIVLPKTPQVAQGPAGAAAPRSRMPDLIVLEPLMKDPLITEIMVNDIRNVMVEKAGKLQFSGLAISSLEELNRITRSILDITGRILSPDQPYVDVMLPDGSRVNIVGPPLTVNGPCITIRKFPARALGMEDLIASGTVDQRLAHFLNCCVVGKLNIVVSGGTGSGKTTLLNVLCSLIPKGERLVVIEDTPELQISHFNSVRLQTKPQTPASPAVLARELVANSLRMRPDRIVVGECRRGEAFDMLQAMNTGHDGSMATLHANSPRDALARLESLSLLAGVDLPLLAIRKQLSSALDLVVQIKRFRNGERKVIQISEVTGMEGETVLLQDIFAFEADAAGSGKIRCTGFVPTFTQKLSELGIEFPSGYFA